MAGRVLWSRGQRWRRDARGYSIPLEDLGLWDQALSDVSGFLGLEHDKVNDSPIVYLQRTEGRDMLKRMPVEYGGER